MNTVQSDTFFVPHVQMKCKRNALLVKNLKIIIIIKLIMNVLITLQISCRCQNSWTVSHNSNRFHVRDFFFILPFWSPSCFLCWLNNSNNSICAIDLNNYYYFYIRRRQVTIIAIIIWKNYRSNYPTTTNFNDFIMNPERLLDFFFI